MRAGSLADRVACTCALPPCWRLPVYFCLSATRQPHAAMQANGSLVCGQAARKLTMAARERHSGGAAAAQRLRASGAAAAREQRGCGECASSIQVKGGLVGLRLHSASGAAGDAWHNAGAAVIPRCQIASREALRAGADGRSCRSVAPHAFGMRQPFGCAYVDRPAMRTSSLISPACLFDRVAALRVAALRVN